MNLHRYFGGSKRAAVVNSNGNNEEPAQKRREEESVPSSEFVDIRAQIRKLERMLEGAEAREVELRAERATNLLDSQRGLIEREKLKEKVEELQKKLDEMNQKLAQYEGGQQLQLPVAVGRSEVARSDDMEDETIDNSPNEPINETMNDNHGGPPNEVSHSESTGEEVVQLGMKCPECQFLTTSDETYIHHLRNEHNTTPKLAGIVLKCGCGKEVASNSHAGKCNIRKFTVVRKRGGPIRRIGDPKVTPKCVLCDKYPGSLNGYASHLRVKHKSTLAANGVYLKCSCGRVVPTEHFSSHHKPCDSDFTLHKMGEE